MRGEEEGELEGARVAEKEGWSSSESSGQDLGTEMETSRSTLEEDARARAVHRGRRVEVWE